MKNKKLLITIVVVILLVLLGIILIFFNILIKIFLLYYLDDFFRQFCWCFTKIIPKIIVIIKKILERPNRPICATFENKFACTVLSVVASIEDGAIESIDV